MWRQGACNRSRMSRKKHSGVSLLLYYNTVYYCNQICGCFSHNKQFTNFPGTPAACPTIQSSSDTIPRVRVRPHRVSPWSHKAAIWNANRKSKLSPVPLTKWLWIRESHDPLLDLINLWYQLTELRKTVYLLTYHFYFKRIQLKNSQMEETHRARGTELPRPLQACHPPRISTHLPTWKTFPSDKEQNEDAYGHCFYSTGYWKF